MLDCRYNDTVDILAAQGLIIGFCPATYEYHASCVSADQRRNVAAGLFDAGAGGPAIGMHGGSIAPFPHGVGHGLNDFRPSWRGCVEIQIASGSHARPKTLTRCRATGRNVLI